MALFGFFWLAPVIIIGVALIFGPLPLVVRGLIRGASGPQITRRWYRPITLGLGIGMVAGVAAMGLISVDLGVNAAVLCVIFLLAAIDWMWRWLPIEWTLALIALGILAALIGGDLWVVLVQIAVPALALLAARQMMLWATKKEALGLGDVWLIAGIGAFLAPFQSFLVVGFAALSGLAEVGLRRWRAGAVAKIHAVAYGTHLCIIFVMARILASSG